jgi:Asp-tRNA(Asn)/Glu-tRNA(Gln) amidotransferase A subunit family amidase
MHEPYAGLSDATALLAAMAKGSLSTRQLMEEHLARLQRFNPGLNAAIEIFEDQALAEAAAPRPGPLSGLPVSVKETFGLQGETITAGSLRMQPLYANRDAAAVARLKAAGAIVLARGNVPEFARQLAGPGGPGHRQLAGRGSVDAQRARRTAVLSRAQQ